MPKPKANKVLAQSENYFPGPYFESSRNLDSSNLPVDSLSLHKSVENLNEQNSELDAWNTELTVQNKSLTRENQKLSISVKKPLKRLLEKVNFWSILGHGTSIFGTI